MANIELAKLGFTNVSSDISLNGSVLMDIKQKELSGNTAHFLTIC